MSALKRDKLTKPYTRIALKYCDDVLSERILTGKLIKKACKRFLKFIERDDMYCDEQNLHDYCDLVEQMQHANRKQFIMEDWQVFLFAGIFLLRWTEDDTLITNTVYHSVARKNGKSALIGALADCNLIFEDPNDTKEPEVIVLANSAKQAQILFNFTNGYAQRLDPKKKVLESFKKEIRNSDNFGICEVLAADPTKLDGYGASLFVIDELHEAKDSRVYDVMVSGQGARENPLGVIITTRGFNTLSFCKEFEDNCISTMNDGSDGEEFSDDPSIFTLIFALDEDDDWNDPSCWKKANPNLGVTVREKYIKAQYKKAKNFGGSTETNFKVKNLNMWQDGEDIWIPDDTIAEHSQPLSWEMFRNQPADIGVDLAATQDLTSITFHFHMNGKHYFKTLPFIPKASLEKRKNKFLWERWVRDGDIQALDGKVTDYRAIIEIVKGICDEYNIQVTDMLYDPWNSAQFVLYAEDAGFSCIPVPQTYGMFNKPLKEFFRQIHGFDMEPDQLETDEAEQYEDDEPVEINPFAVKKKGDIDSRSEVASELEANGIILDSNRCTRYNFRCVRIKTDQTGKYSKPVKDSEYHKIDIVVTILLSYGAWLHRMSGSGIPRAR